MIPQILDALVALRLRAPSDRRITRLFLLSLLLICAAVPAATGQGIRFLTRAIPKGLTHAPAQPNKDYIYDANARADNGAEVRYSLSRGPAGMKVDPITGVVTWRPTENGVHVVTLHAALATNPSIRTFQEWILAVPGLPKYENYRIVAGAVYRDVDRDCVHDTTELKMEREIVEVLPGPAYAITGSDGYLNVILPPGTYTFNYYPKRYWLHTCLPHEGTTVTLPDSSMKNIRFAVDMIPGIRDVRTSLAVGAIRPGFDVTYTLIYENVGSERATGRVIFEPDSRLIYKSATTTPDRQLSGRYEWYFTDLPVGKSVAISIGFSTPQTIARGTSICAFADVRLERKYEGEFLGDNRDSVCTTVTGSYDPNDIMVAPVRFDEEYDNAPLFPSDTILSYLVRFQNTGNDTAFTVTVSDTLDPSLFDIRSIQLGAASHDFDFDISGSGILTWTFNNILLPDSNVNELASHGYFKYSVHLRKGLAPMTQISNRAAIYFDYNVPVITNTVVSVTSGTLSVGDDRGGTASLEIYPNPVSGTSSIRLNLTEREHVSLRLIDGRGDVIAILNDREMNPGEHTLSLDARGLASGAYYLTLERGGEKEIYPIVVSR